jgi:hypothetical protein
MKGRYHLGNLGEEGEIILKADLEQGPVASCCEHSHESLCSMKYADFPDELSDYKLLNKDSAPWSYNNNNNNNNNNKIE